MQGVCLGERIVLIRITVTVQVFFWVEKNLARPNAGNKGEKGENILLIDLANIDFLLIGITHVRRSS